MRTLLAMVIAIACAGVCFGQQADKATPSNKAKAKPVKQKFAVDFKKVDRDFLARVKRGSVIYPDNSPRAMQSHMRGAETDSVTSWANNSPVDTVGLLPQFYIHIEQIIDEKDATAGTDGEIWLSGWETKQWKEGEEAQIPISTVKIGQKRFNTNAGSKTVRSLELQSDAEQAAEARGKKQ